MELHGRQIVAGSVVAAGEATIRAEDPATGDRLEPAFFESTQAEVDRALAAAVEARVALRELPAAARAGFLDAVAAGIEALGEALVQRAAAETGLPQARLENERGRTCGQLRMFAELSREGSWVDARIDHGDPRRQPLPKPDLRRMLVPIGPVAVFGASNFPLAFSVAGGDTAAALAAGCPVVVKAHPGHPGTSELVGEVLRSAVAERGLPDGTFSLLHGARPETGLALVRHPSTRAVGFTGSLTAGRALFDAAAARPEPIPVFAEMASVNPVFLLPGALAGERAAATAGGLHQSVVLGVGQFCTKPGLVVALAGDDAERCLEALAGHLRATPPGTMLHRGILDSYRAGVARTAAVHGVRAVVQPAPAAGGAAGTALFATDAVTWLANPELAEEVFGPSTVFVRCADLAEMRRVAENLPGQLAAAVHGDAAELVAHRDLLRVLQEAAGRLVFNGFPTGVEVCAAMQHGGPYPATTDPRSTSVGGAAIQRFTRPVAYQNAPPELLPDALREDNPLGILRLVDGEFTREGR